MGVPHFSSTFFVCLYHRYRSFKIEQLLAVLLGIDEHPVNKKKEKLVIYFLKTPYLFIRLLIKITITIPKKLPNKSDHSKLLAGMIACNNSSIIDKDIK